MGKRLGLVLIAACGSPQHAPKPEEPGPRVITYSPLGIKSDAKQKNQAVILGTDANTGPTLLPLPGATAQASVDAMFVKLGGKEPASGGMTPVKLSTAPNTEGTVQVGIFEEMAVGVGPQCTDSSVMPNSGWM